MTIATDLKVIISHFVEELIEVVITNSDLSDKDDNNTVYGIAVGLLEANNLTEVLKQTLRDILQPGATVVGRMVTTEDSDDDDGSGEDNDFTQHEDDQEDYEASQEEQGLRDLEDEENDGEAAPPYFRDEDYLD